MAGATRLKAETRRRLCPGSDDSPAAIFHIRWKGPRHRWDDILGECRRCAHSFTLNNNRDIRAHGSHGCIDGIYVPDCPRGQTVHLDGYEVLNDMRLDGDLELSAGRIFLDA